MTRPDPDDVGLEILRPNGAGPLYDTCDMPVGPDGATCMLPGDHRDSCLARPSHGPRSANDPIETTEDVA